MIKTNSLLGVIILGAMILISCGESSNKTNNAQQQTDSTTANANTAPTATKPQTTEERIAEIQQWTQ